MKRRNFLVSAFTFLGVGKLFAKEERPKLPVAKFANRHLTNGAELFANSKRPTNLIMDERVRQLIPLANERSILVWVNEQDAFKYGGQIIWGEAELVERVYNCYTLRDTAKSKYIKHNLCWVE